MNEYRTLFNCHRASVCNSEKDQAHMDEYQWLPSVDVVPINGSQLLINRKNGGWASTPSGADLTTPPPGGEAGEFLWLSGLCSKDGSAADFTRTRSLEKQLNFFEFCVTEGCNLGCKYCFANANPAKTSNTASLELAERFVDRIMEYRENTGSCAKYSIEFTGGEPLLKFEIIKHTIDYAQERYGNALNADFLLQTNMTIISDEIAKYLKANNVALSISLDGSEEIQDSIRPFASGKGSFSAIMKNLELLQRHQLRIGGVISVITPENISRMAEVAAFHFNTGFRAISFRPYQQLGRGQEQEDVSLANSGDDYVEELFSVLTKVIEPVYKRLGTVLVEESLSRIFRNILSSHRLHMCDRTPCGAGRSIVVVKPNGDTYPCNQYNSNEGFCMGNIYQKSFEGLLNAPTIECILNRSWKEIDACKDCPIGFWCQSPCAIGSHAKYGDHNSVSADCDLNYRKYMRAVEGLVEGEFDLQTVGMLLGHGRPVDLRWIEV